MTEIKQETLNNILDHGARLNEALIEIRRLYLRSNKRDKHTCWQMYRVAVKALEEVEAAPGLDAPADASSVQARWG